MFDQRDAINKIKHYEEIIKTGNKSTVSMSQFKDRCLKKFRDTEDLLKTLDLVD